MATVKKKKADLVKEAIRLGATEDQVSKLTIPDLVALIAQLESEGKTAEGTNTSDADLPTGDLLNGIVEKYPQLHAVCVDLMKRVESYGYDLTKTPGADWLGCFDFLAKSFKDCRYLEIPKVRRTILRGQGVLGIGWKRSLRNHIAKAFEGVGDGKLFNAFWRSATEQASVVADWEEATLNLLATEALDVKNTFGIDPNAGPDNATLGNDEEDGEEPEAEGEAEEPTDTTEE